VGLQRVGGDHRCGEVEVGQQRGEGGDLARCAVDLALGQHRAVGVVHHGQQVDLAAVCCASGAAQRLAVDRDRPSPPIMAVGMGMAAGKPAADHRGQGLGVQPGKGAADRGLGGHRPVAGEGVAAGAERGTDRLGRVGGPLGDRCH
jgi:hypothetical protein